VHFQCIAALAQGGDITQGSHRSFAGCRRPASATCSSNPKHSLRQLYLSPARPQGSAFTSSGASPNLSIVFVSDFPENAVFADELRQLGQKLSKPCILLNQGLRFVCRLVSTGCQLIPAKGIFK
jgi:hypothetical protein